MDPIATTKYHPHRRRVSLPVIPSRSYTDSMSDQRHLLRRQPPRSSPAFPHRRLLHRHFPIPHPPRRTRDRESSRPSRGCLARNDLLWRNSEGNSGRGASIGRVDQLEGDRTADAVSIDCATRRSTRRVGCPHLRRIANVLDRRECGTRRGEFESSTSGIHGRRGIRESVGESWSGI